MHIVYAYTFPLLSRSPSNERREYIPIPIPRQKRDRILKKKKKTNNVSINFWTSLGIILYIKIIMYTYIIYMNGTHIRMHRKREKKKVILFIFFETNTSSRNYALNDVNRLCRTRGFYVTLSKFDRRNEQWSVNFDIISFRSHYLHSIPSRFFFLFLSFLFLRKRYL